MARKDRNNTGKQKKVDYSKLLNELSKKSVTAGENVSNESKPETYPKKK